MTTPSYTPSDFANYARLGCCPKYLERLAGSKTKPRGSSGGGAYRSSSSNIDPYYSKIGKLHEDAFEKHLTKDLNFEKASCLSIKSAIKAMSAETPDSNLNLYVKEVGINIPPSLP